MQCLTFSRRRKNVQKMYSYACSDVPWSVSVSVLVTTVDDRLLNRSRYRSGVDSRAPEEPCITWPLWDAHWSHLANTMNWSLRRLWCHLMLPLLWSLAVIVNLYMYCGKVERTFRCFGYEVDGLGLAAQVLTAAVDPDVHDLYTSVGLRQRHIARRHSLVQQSHPACTSPLSTHG